MVLKRESFMRTLRLFPSIILILTIILAGFSGPCQPKQQYIITPISSFSQVDFDPIDPDTLVIFDVDQTLIQPIDMYPASENSPQAEQFRNYLVKIYPNVDWIKITSIMLSQAKRPLIEPMIIDEIKKLQARQVRVIACTSMNTGPYGILSSMQEWRYNHLKSLGFEGSFSNVVINFDQFDHKPVFYKGMFATDTIPKGLAIDAFLDAIDLHPKKIIFFDDDSSYQDSVRTECMKRHIPFQGYLYQGAKSVAWDEELGKFQADYLIKNQIWLSDVAAREQMKSRIQDTDN
jgi:hypothetical protein